KKQKEQEICQAEQSIALQMMKSLKHTK
ncbi:MAG: hypothetical protein Q4E87_05065, partial [bacterium]|nr:hypothetical protein [bacterium]